MSQRAAITSSLEPTYPAMVGEGPPGALLRSRNNSQLVSEKEIKPAKTAVPKPHRDKTPADGKIRAAPQAVKLAAQLTRPQRDMSQLPRRARRLPYKCRCASRIPRTSAASGTSPTRFNIADDPIALHEPNGRPFTARK